MTPSTVGEPLLSICVPTYNRADMLRDALESVANQSIHDFECIISDNASTDHTREIVDPFLRDSRFRYFRHPANTGSVYNVYYASTRLARGKYCVVLCDDDYYIDNNYLMEAVQCLEQNEEVVFVHARVSHLHTATGKITELTHHTPEQISGRELFLILGTEKYVHVYLMTSVFRRALALECKFCEDIRVYHSDYLNWLLMSLRGKVAYFDRPIGIYRFHGKNEILSRDVERWLNDIEFIHTAYDNALQSRLYSEEELRAWYSRMRFTYCMIPLRLAFEKGQLFVFISAFRRLSISFGIHKELRIWRALLESSLIVRAVKVLWAILKNPSAYMR